MSRAHHSFALRRRFLGCAWCLLLAAAASAPASAAQAAPVVERGSSTETLEQAVFLLRHQPAAEALSLLRAMLSERGTVELQPARNTLVVVDLVDRLTQIEQLLREFDHPPRRLRVSIQILEASRQVSGPSGDPTHPPAALAQKLRELLRYNQYRILAESEFETQEGRTLRYELGSEYVVRFKVGTVLAGKRLKLNDFAVLRHGAQRGARQEDVLLNAHLALRLEHTLALTFAQDEGSETGLVVAITCQPVGAAAADR